MQNSQCIHNFKSGYSIFLNKRKKQKKRFGAFFCLLKKIFFFLKQDSVLISSKKSMMRNKNTLRYKIVVTKKQGKAVSRNKIKRIIKSCLVNIVEKRHKFVNNSEDLSLLRDLTIVGYKNALDCRFDDLSKEVNKDIVRIFSL